MGRAIRLVASMATAVLLASVVVLVMAIDSARSIASAAARPNIVFVLTDDQFPGTENAMPALKKDIISQGVEFINMTSTYPLCCPARATIERGQYAHNTHIYGNELPLGDGQSSAIRDCRTAPSPPGCTTPDTRPVFLAST